METFDVSRVAEDVTELYEAAAEEHGVAFASAIEPGLLVRGNRELIARTLANLLDNGLKYGAPASSGIAPELRLVVRRTGAVVRLSIEDRGPGVPAADRNRVLDRFVRLEASRTLPGSGLGLSLAAAIAHLHGGALKLEDNAPGLRAVLELPHSSPAPGASGNRSGETKSGS